MIFFYKKNLEDEDFLILFTVRRKKTIFFLYNNLIIGRIRF